MSEGDESQGNIIDISPKEEEEESISGARVIPVKNLELAVCLVSVGVPLRKDPPYTHFKLANGQEEWTFMFEESTSDGVFATVDLIKAFSEDMKWVEEHPEHPFTFAMAAVKNLNTFKAHISRSVPYVAFQAQQGKATLYVKEGGRKYERCLQKGMIQK